MRLAGLVVALAAFAEAQHPETPGANGEVTTTTLYPLPFETTSSEIPVLDKTTSGDVILPKTSTGTQVLDSAFTSTGVFPEQPETQSTDITVGGPSTANVESPLDPTSSGEVPIEQPITGSGHPTGPDTATQQPPAIDTTTSQVPPVAETTTQPIPALDTATTDPTPDIETTSQQPAPQPTTEQGPAVDTTAQQPAAQDSTTEQLAPQDTTSKPYVGEETTSTQAPVVDTTSSEQPEVPSTTEKPDGPKPTTTTEQGGAGPTSKDEEFDPKSEGSDNEDPKTKDETDPEPTTKKDEAPVTVPPAAVTAEPQETISGVSDNTLHSTKDSDGNDVVVPVLFGPSCLIFCEHAGKDNGPGGIVLWGIGPAPGSYVLPPLPGITPAPSAVVINGGVPTPVGTQTPEDPDDQDDDDDKSTADEETKTEAKTTEAKSTAESSAASTTEASTTELPQLTMGVETVVVNVDATPTTGATSSEATTEATSTEASTQTTELPQLTMGVDTVVVDIDATPTSGGTTETSAETSTETTELPQLTMGVDTVVIDVDATPTTGGTTETFAESATTEESSTGGSETTETQDTTAGEMTTTEATAAASTTEQSTTGGPTSTETSVQSTTFATSTTTKEPERGYPCIIHANPGIDPYCACETTVSGKGFYVSTDLISSSCADYTTFPSSIPTDALEPKVTEKPDPEPFVKTDDGTVVSYPDRTVKVGNYPGGKYTYTQGVGDAVTLETPLPTQTDANNKGSSQCGSIDDACDRALNDGFDDETVYKDYVSRYARIQSGMIMVASFGQAGCTAQFKCNDYGLGMKGKDIKDAVQHMKDNDGHDEVIVKSF
ncbi:hypothetical protein FGADI_2486 [Fusarium gaditjirri]|uniref:Uncharacterized protein n=1 Tax=Fusarium gaditjirri TaxID=282569 RepID=A0A8H4THZ3_9HYPO|nr:hypothetical protein FGADI_2486 [Fusarium gaditjirri]